MPAFFAKLIPFFFAGILFVLFVVGLIFLSYLLIFGAVVGLLLFVIVWIKERFFTKKPPPPYSQIKKPKSGRTIDHDNL